MNGNKNIYSAELINFIQIQQVANEPSNTKIEPLSLYSNLQSLKPFKQNPSNMTSYTRIWPHAWVVFSPALSDCCWKANMLLSSGVPFNEISFSGFNQNIEEQCQSVSISGCIRICPHFMSKLIDMISSNFQHSHMTPSCATLHIYTVPCQASASSFSTLAFSWVKEHDANSTPPENVLKIHLSQGHCRHC